MNFVLYSNPILALVCVPPDAPPRFSLESTAQLTGIHPQMLRYYWRARLLDSNSGSDDGELWFDEKALGQLRRIQYYRRRLQVPLRALPLLCALWNEGERRQIALRFLAESAG